LEAGLRHPGGSVSDRELASWAGVCPGNNESAGKRKSTRIPKGNVYLKTALVDAANAAARTTSFRGGATQIGSKRTFPIKLINGLTSSRVQTIFAVHAR
jgi:transposase